MSIPLISLLIACILPIALSWVGGYYRNQQLGTIDNKNPRAQNAQLSGAGARAVAAQQNAWEALAVFTAALFVAHQQAADPKTMALACEIFIVARVLHGVFYLADKDMLRSVAFLASYGCSIWLFFI